MSKSEYKFSSPGSLPTPGWIGRLVRFLMSALCSYAVYELIITYDQFTSGTPNNAMIWVLILLAFHLLPPVLNIGLGRIWHSKPQFWFLILFYLTTMIAGNLQGTYDPPISGYILFIMTIYVFAHLGISFLISSLLATPGCEMRSIPQLISIISGKESKEHFCPGFIDGIDKWERKLHNDVK